LRAALPGPGPYVRSAGGESMKQAGQRCCHCCGPRAPKGPHNIQWCKDFQKTSVSTQLPLWHFGLALPCPAGSFPAAPEPLGAVPWFAVVYNFHSKYHCIHCLFQSMVFLSHWTRTAQLMPGGGASQRCSLRCCCTASTGCTAVACARCPSCDAAAAPACCLCLGHK
jgi:hypothetical protein